MSPNYPEFLTHHYIISIIMLFVWIGVYLFGKRASEDQIKWFTVFLITISIVQEIADYIIRLQGAEAGLYEFKWTKEMPLQPCHFAYLASIIAMWKKNIHCFYIAYFFGMSGAFLGILTPGGGIYSVATNLTQHFQHSFIILNLAWCIGALNMRATKRSILFALFVLNLLVIPIGTYNYFTGENFFFLREAPVTLVYNPLLPVTTWPWYILWIEMIFIPYCYLFYLPIRED